MPLGASVGLAPSGRRGARQKRERSCLPSLNGAAASETILHAITVACPEARSGQATAPLHRICASVRCMAGRHRSSARDTEPPDARGAIAAVIGSWAKTLRASWVIALTALMIRFDSRVVTDVLAIVLISKH